MTALLRHRFVIPSLLFRLVFWASAPTAGAALVDAWRASDLSVLNDGDAVASKMTRNIARVVIDRLAETSTKLVSLLND